MNYGFPEKLTDEVLPLGGDEMFLSNPSQVLYYTIKDGNWDDPAVWECTGKNAPPYPNSRNHSVIIRNVIYRVSGTVDVLNFIVRSKGPSSISPGIIRVYGELDTPYDWSLYGGEIDIFGSVKNRQIHFSGYAVIYSDRVNEIQEFGIGSLFFLNTLQTVRLSGYLSINNRLEFRCNTFLNNVYTVDAPNLVNSVITTTGNSYVIATNCKIKIGSLQGTINFIDCDRVEVVSYSNITNLTSPDEGSILYANITDAPGVYRSFRLDSYGVCDIKILIAAGRTLLLSYWYAASGDNIKVLGKQINGEDSASTLIVSGVALSGNTSVDGEAFHFQFPECPMATGIMTCDAKSEVWYDRDGDQQVKGTTYNNLVFAGSGVKKLMGNVTVNNEYVLSGTASVDLNGFTLTTP